MRVLILTTQYLPHIGGSEMAIANLTKRLPDVQFDIMSSGFGGFARGGSASGWKWLMPITGFLRAVGKKYDVIHAFQASYAGGAGFFLKLLYPSVPFIVSLQEGKPLERQSLFVRFVRTMILRKADVITAISNYLLEYAKKINPKAKTYLLPNGVSISPHPLLPVRGGAGGAIVTVSRLVYKNGVDTLIRAMELLPEYTLTIVGDGPLRGELGDIAQKLGVADRVVFAGPMANELVPKYLAQASVFVRPSRSEGLGISFLEAMAAGVPVIAPPVGGIPDIIKDRQTGLFCKVDDPQSVADAVRAIAHDDELRTTIVTKALQLVRDHYDWDILARHYYELLKVQ